jgi:hypothetical protein
VTATATGFVALALPLLVAPRTVSSLRREGRTAFREPLHFIVTSVTVVTLPTPMRFLCDGPIPEVPSTVTPIVTEKSPSLCGSLSGVTLVTLVTVDCGFSLEVPSSSTGWWHSGLRRSGTPARLPQTLCPTSSFGHSLDQAQSGPRVPKSRVVAARQLLVLVATPL